MTPKLCTTRSTKPTKTTADAVMLPHKKNKPGNKCKKFKNENGKRGNNSVTMHKPKPKLNCKIPVKQTNITFHISCDSNDSNDSNVFTQRFPFFHCGFRFQL